MASNIIIMAAGKGSRLRSSIPKVLHCVAGKPLLQRVVESARCVKPDNIFIICGRGRDQVQAALPDEDITWVYQAEQLGTGHAVMQVLPHINPSDKLVILSGDVPLISPDTIQALLKQTPDAGMGLVVADVDNPFGLGRIIRNENDLITGIVEERDATAEQKRIHEINAGIMLMHGHQLQAWLPTLQSDNAQGEYYLTDCLALAVNQSVTICPIKVSDPLEIQGVNTREQLANLERIYQRQVASQLMSGGVTLLDPARLDCRGDISICPDVTIDTNVILEGTVKISSFCTIEANCILRDVELGEGVHIKANSIIEGSRIAANAVVGPFARIRPDTVIEEGAHIGNFVEVKKSTIGSKSKVSHLSYIGDTLMGQSVNIGAGTITCNYDGANKHQTRIEDGVFVGSDTQLVAPVTLKAGSTIAAGTTVTKDTPTDSLVLSRVQQKHITGWQRPSKKEES